MTKKQDVRRETVLASGGRDPEHNFGIVNPPVYHASTVTSPTLAEWRARDFTKDITYGRMGTPTQKSLEEAVALVEGGDRAIAVSSGLASITTAISAFVEAGDHILVSDSAYFPTRNFCNNVMAKYGVETTYYDPLIGEFVRGHGRNGIPLYVLYGGEPDAAPLILPQLLTTRVMLEALDSVQR